jgi:hypothetical protein
MSKTILAGVLAAGVLPILMHSPNANADFVQKTFSCPGTGKIILPAGSNVSIDDIIISTDKVQTVTIKFRPANLIVMTAYMNANETVVSNFQGNVEGDNDQNLKLDCSGTAGTKVSVTVVGNGSL